LAKKFQIKVTMEAPDFEVSDSRGHKIRLSSYRGLKNVVLVFNRGFG